MPNLDFEFSRGPDHETPGTAIAKIRALGGELSLAAKHMLEDAQSEGERVARAEVPKGPPRKGQHTKLADQIHKPPIRYSPGGFGGGGFYEAELWAGGPDTHLGFVFGGTGGESRKFTTSRGKPIPIEKEGEGVHFRMSFHGQEPQQRWWHHAQDAMNARLEENIHTARFIHGL